MKKILLYLTFLSAAYNVAAQEFMQTISPSSSNPEIKMDCRLFNGDYRNNGDFVDLLAISGDCTVYDTDKKIFVPMRGNIYSIYAVQQQGTGASGDSSATIFASINKNDKDPLSQDAGGIITFKIKRDKPSGAWKVITEDFGGPDDRDIYFKKISFSAVGGTIANQSFLKIANEADVSPRMLLIENVSGVNSNKDLAGLADTSDFKYPSQFTQKTQIRSIIPADKIVKKYQSLGWPIQIDLATGTVVGKVHRMGRGITSMLEFGGAIYMVLGGSPSVLLRYQSFQSSTQAKKLDFIKGDNDIGGDGSIYLSAYKQNEDGSGQFIFLNNTVKLDSVPGFVTVPGNPNPVLGKVPTYEQNFDSLMVLKDIALRAGATMFANIGDLAISQNEYGENVILITEKGLDVSGDAFKTGPAKYANLAKHLQNLDAKDNNIDKSFSDPYGRVLAMGGFTSNTYDIFVLAEGGQTVSNTLFSNPSKLEVINDVAEGGSQTILIKEDVPAVTLGRNPSTINSYSNRINEVFSLEAKGVSTNGQLKFLPNTNQVLAPITKDMKLIMAGSNGSDFTSNFVGIDYAVTLTNSKDKSDYSSDTYLTVVNGMNGTDKSMIMAVRNIYPSADPCLKPTGLLDVNINDSDRLQIWPNPTKESIQMSEKGNYTLMDLRGQEIMKVLSDNSMDLTPFPKGMYFIKDQKGHINKIVKE
ncbi:MAG: T9SS type A sorting domain-containing protein [Opitutaceae bacterium]|nr:T9SS type A sorting domain-containing protein [Cytophagales bacterium]